MKSTTILLLLGVMICLVHAETNVTITVNPQLEKNVTNYQSLDDLLANVSVACKSVDQCLIYLVNNQTHNLTKEAKIESGNNVNFYAYNTSVLANISVQNQITIANRSNVLFSGLSLYVETQKSLSAVFNVADPSKFTLKDSNFNATNQTQRYASVSGQGGVSFYNVNASINITGANFVDVNQGQIDIQKLHLINVIGGQKDILFNLDTLLVASVKVLEVLNTQVSIFKLNNVTLTALNVSISNVQNPNYVFNLANNSTLDANNLQISNVNLSASENNSTVSAIVASESLVRLNNYVCSNVTAQSFPCLRLTLTSNLTWGNSTAAPVSNSSWSNNNVTGKLYGLALIATSGSNSYLYQQFDRKTRKLVGGNTFSNNVQNSSVIFRYTGQFDLKVSVAASNGSSTSINSDNTLVVSNVNTNGSLLNNVNITLTDVLLQPFDNVNQAADFNTTALAFYLVAPHNTSSLSVVQWNATKIPIQAPNATTLVAALKNTTLFNSSYVVPANVSCANNKSLLAQNSSALNFTFDGLQVSLNLTDVTANSSTTTWYLLGSLNLEQNSAIYTRNLSNYVNINGSSLFTLPLQLVDTTCNGGKGLTCQAGSYQDVQNERCAACDSSCSSCNGAGWSSCTACSDRLLVPQNGTCACRDNSKPVLINGQCYSTGDARSLVNSYDFQNVTSLSDLQVKLRVAVNFASAASASGLNVATASSPCGSNNTCSGQGKCNNTCVCNDKFGGSLCQYSSDDFTNVVTRTVNASFQLNKLVQNQKVDGPQDVQNELLATLLLTQVREGLTQTTLLNLNNLLDVTTSQASAILKNLALGDFEDLIGQLDLTLATSVDKFNNTNGNNLTKQLYNNLQSNINTRIVKDIDNLVNKSNAQASFASSGLSVSYTLLNTSNVSAPATTTVGGNQITLPTSVLQQVQSSAKNGTNSVVKVVNFNYNPRKLQSDFQAQSSVVLTQVLQGSGAAYNDVTVDTSKLNSQSIQVAFAFPANATNAKCYTYNNQSALWSQSSNGELKQAQLNCQYNQFGLLSASNSTKGTVPLNAMIRMFSFGFLAILLAFLF